MNEQTTELTEMMIDGRLELSEPSKILVPCNHDEPTWSGCDWCYETIQFLMDRLHEGIEYGNRKEVAKFWKTLPECVQLEMRHTYDGFMRQTICTRCNHHVSRSGCGLCDRQMNIAIANLESTYAEVRTTGDGYGGESIVRCTFTGQLDHPNNRFKKLFNHYNETMRNACLEFDKSVGGFSFIYQDGPLPL